jgi:hypothetical protein
MKTGFSIKAFFARLYGVRAPAGATPVTAAVFPEINGVPGKIIRSGAFEFLAETPIGEVRGRLADPDREPPEGSPVSIRIPSRCIRIDTVSPEENAFAGRVVSCVPAGASFEVRFETDAGLALHILAGKEPPACEPGELLYAWVFPEDVVGG